MEQTHAKLRSEFRTKRKKIAKNKKKELNALVNRGSENRSNKECNKKKILQMKCSVER